MQVTDSSGKPVQLIIPIKYKTVALLGRNGEIINPSHDAWGGPMPASFSLVVVQGSYLDNYPYGINDIDVDFAITAYSGLEQRAFNSTWTLTLTSRF
jgi:hypothetical protein